MDHTGFESRILLAAYGERLSDALGAGMPIQEIQGILKRIGELGASFTGEHQVLTTRDLGNTVPFQSLSVKVLAEIEAFLAEDPRRGPTRFGLQAVNDSHLVSRLRKGLSITLKTADKVRNYMRMTREIESEKQFYRLHD